jgi:hypothetical protein
MYVAADPENRALMPFGLRGKPGEANFDLFQEALMEALGLAQGQGQGPRQVTLHQAPKRLWLVAGRGFCWMCCIAYGPPPNSWWCKRARKYGPIILECRERTE